VEVVLRQVVSGSTYLLYQQCSVLTPNRNRAELAEGWYDPVTKEKADRATSEVKPSRHSPPSAVQPKQDHHRHEHEQEAAAGQPVADHEDSEDEYAPSLPTNLSRVGPTVPSIQDLQYRNGTLTPRLSAHMPLRAYTLQNLPRKTKLHADKTCASTGRWIGNCKKSA